jgi:hypothetical protein
MLPAQQGNVFFAAADLLPVIAISKCSRRPYRALVFHGNSVNTWNGVEHINS